MTMVFYINGKFVLDSEARLSPLDRGFLFGDGLYDTLRAHEGRLFAIEEHLARLRSSCESLYITLPHDDSRWRGILNELLERNQLSRADARLRITVSRGTGGDIRGLDAGEPTIFVHAHPVSQATFEEARQTGKTAIFAGARRGVGDPVYNIKITSLAHTVAALREAAAACADEAIFLNANNDVCEFTTSNFFMIREGVLLTPPTDAPCLPGVSRAHVLQVAQAIDVPTNIVPITADDVLCADEVFSCSSVAEIVPIVSVSCRPVGTGKPGPLASRLQVAYRQLVADYAGK